MSTTVPFTDVSLSNICVLNGDTVPPFDMLSLQGSTKWNFTVPGVGFTIGIGDFRGRALAGVSGEVMWAARMSSTGDDRVYGNAPTNDGGMVAVGIYGGTLTAYHSSGVAFGTTLGISGGNEGFIVKYNSSGGVLWVARVVGSGDERLSKVTCLADGSILAIGSCSSTVTAYNSNGTVGGTLTNGSICALIIKYSATGTFQWMTRIITGATQSPIISKTNDGGFVAGGYYSTTLTAYNINGTAFATTLPGDDGFIAKYDSSGNVQFLARVGSTAGQDDIRSIGVLSDDSIVVTGSSVYNNSGAIVYAYSANGQQFATGIPISGNNDPFLVKYSSTGMVQWVCKYIATSFDSGDNIIILPDDSIIVSCVVYSTTVTIYNSDGTAFSPNFTNTGVADHLIVKYNSNGFVQWHTCVGGTAASVPINGCALPDGGFIVTGFGTGTVVPYSVGAIAFSTSIPNAGSNDAYVVAYSAAGVVRWIARMAGTGDDTAFNACVLSDGTGMVVVGNYQNSTFTPYSYNGTAFSTTLPNAGSYDGFIVKYSI